MKGISFQNGVEFKIHIEGESWSQGDTIEGSLEAVVRNAGATPPLLHVLLADGVDKKIKAKSDDAFQVLEKAQAGSGPLSWKFTLPLHARVTDKNGSLYVLYGSSENATTLGQLKLNILPHLHLREIIEVLTHHFRFVVKTIISGKKGFVEFKLDPPDTRDWVSLEQLVLSLKHENETISAKFNFRRNEVDSVKAGLQTKKTQREIERAWEISKIVHGFNQRLNKDEATTSIDEVIAQYKTAGWLS